MNIFVSSRVGGAKVGKTGLETNGIKLSPILSLSMSCVPLGVNIRLSHSAHRKKRNFLQKADITLAYGKASATTHLHCGVCPGKRRDDHAFLPTVSGADKARLYRTQVGSELLAGPTRTPGATRSGIEGASR